MLPRTALALAAAVPLLLAGCRSPEEKLMDRRRELRSLLDDLYADYRGGEPAREEDGGGVVGRIFGEMDRSHLEQQCLALGRGERAFTPSARLEAFLKENERACRKAADLQVDIEALEREQGGRAP